MDIYLVQKIKNEGKRRVLANIIILINLFLFYRYYNQGEIKDFEGNECEWPIFYTFMIIDGVFKNNNDQVEEYQAELRKCMYSDENGGSINQFFSCNTFKNYFNSQIPL